jgi:hypothetical protein
MKKFDEIGKASMREMTSGEVECVSGGIFDLVAAYVGTQIGVAIGSDLGCAAGGGCSFTPIEAT